MTKTGPLHKAIDAKSVDELCKDMPLQLLRGAGSDVVHAVASPKNAEAGSLVLLTTAAYLADIKGKKGLICLVSSDMVEASLAELDACTILASNTAKADFIHCLNRLFPPPPQNPHIDKTAHISPTAIIAPDVRIEAFVTIGAGCHIASGCIIETGAILNENVHLEAGCHIGAYSCLSYAKLGPGVNISSHCTIGKRGFGFEGQGESLHIHPHLGGVNIGAGCDIGAGTVIDRGVLEDTIIGAHVMIDNLCHIAHNVHIGDHCLILGQVGIAGSAIIGKNCILAGQVGVADHMKIVDDCIFTSKAGVTKNIDHPGMYSGFPAIPSRAHWKERVAIRKLAENTLRHNSKRQTS